MAFLILSRFKYTKRIIAIGPALFFLSNSTYPFSFFFLSLFLHFHDNASLYTPLSLGFLALFSFYFLLVDLFSGRRTELRRIASARLGLYFYWLSLI